MLSGSSFLLLVSLLLLLVSSPPNAEGTTAAASSSSSTAGSTSPSVAQTPPLHGITSANIDQAKICFFAERTNHIILQAVHAQTPAAPFVVHHMHEHYVLPPQHQVVDVVHHHHVNVHMFHHHPLPQMQIPMVPLGRGMPSLPPMGAVSGHIFLLVNRI